jgi:prepilin-type N-terminal cleavage/methylation domain-containing protein
MRKFIYTSRREKNRRAGFTLLELSIVIVVITLIMGSILVAQSLIRSAQLRSVTSEATRYTQAITNFRDKYMALPGDFAGAEALWGTASGGCPYGIRTGTQTCNGNGDGNIMTVGDSPNYPASNFWANTCVEPLQAWQHLANAGMIDGNYYQAHNTNDAIPGVTVPASQLAGAGWLPVTITLGNCSNLPAGRGSIPLGCNRIGIAYQPGDTPPNTVLLLSGQVTSFLYFYPQPVLLASEALLIDQKMDDGLPTTGKVVASSNSNSGWTQNCYNASNQYDMTQSGVVCALFFKTGL